MMVALPKSDCVLLRVAVWVVPAEERAEWLRCWQGELWHRRHPRTGVVCGAAELYPGLVRDALWLRADEQRRALAGTALLCMLSLGALMLLAGLPLLVFVGNARMLGGYLAANALRFACEGALVTLVSFATAARFVEHSARVSAGSHVRASLFQAAKIALVLAIAFLLSCDVTQPLYGVHPFTAEFVQPEIFVLLALVGLRWSFGDSDGRCKHCLRTLALPTRVGRPSRNFLDSNGTELLCEAGHGVLSVPEMETSWRRSSKWIAA